MAREREGQCGFEGLLGRSGELAVATRQQGMGGLFLNIQILGDVAVETNTFGIEKMDHISSIISSSSVCVCEGERGERGRNVRGVKSAAFHLYMFSYFKKLIEKEKELSQNVYTSRNRNYLSQ